MSARLSTALPRACSGDMYAAVPMIMPASVMWREVVGEWESSALDEDEAGSPSRAFARPKSRTFTLPSGVTLMFAGFRSRWMMPCSCASSRPSASCFAMAIDSSMGMAPRSFREIFPKDEFHHQGDGGSRPDLLDAVDRRDVWMIERRKQLRLAFESGEAFWVPRHLGGKDLDRHITVEPRVARAVHLAHPARADGRGDFTGAEASSGRKSHVLLTLSHSDVHHPFLLPAFFRHESHDMAFDRLVDRRCQQCRILH